MKSLTIAVTLMTTFAAFSLSYGLCRPPVGWHSKSLVERMKLEKAKVVVLATAVATHPAYPYKYPYTADLTVDCIFKDTSGEAERLPLQLNSVPGFGGTWDCAETRVVAGTQYILFLNREGSLVRVDEVNDQAGAEPAIPSRLEKVYANFQCKVSRQ